MPTAHGHDATTYFETIGDPADPAVLLLCGLGQQLVDWPPLFIHTLAIAGYYVVALDNRDAGLSSHFPGKVNLNGLRAAIAAGGPVEVPYRLSDMAADTKSVIDAIGAQSVHMLGSSMGGMIAQAVTIEYPERVRSLTSIMAATGAADIGAPSAVGRQALFRAPPMDKAGAVRSAVETDRLLATPGPFDPEAAAALAAWRYERAFDPAGTGRQLAAIWASGDRTADLRRLAVPTLVIHGDRDELVDVTGGRATAAAVPDARYVEIPGLNHDYPAALLPSILRPIVTHLNRAEALAAS